jgi:hypothetical protein
MITRATMTALAVLLLGPPGAAPAAARPAPAAASQEGGLPAPLPAIELPINLERVKRQLEALPGSEEARSRLKLEFYINVYARAPRFDPLEGFDIHTGLVPYGAPSHAEMMRQWAPRGFDVPVANLGPILGWIIGR